MTLRAWQQTVKPKEELLYNCSEFSQLNDEYVPFPIGMGWSIINYCGDIQAIQRGTHEQTVLCAIHTHTDQRRRGTNTINRLAILDTLRINDIHNIYIDSPAYFEALPSYKFIISPEGNGVDCHRHYEALMAGCIPIIECNDMIVEKYRDCPILYTKDYSEINTDYLLQKYNEMLDTEYDFSRLMLHSYPSDVQHEIKSNGNYWSSRLVNRTWYD